MQRPGFPQLKAVQGKRVMAFYHQFYDAPFYFVAELAMAKELYPDLFKDVDPEAVFVEGESSGRIPGRVSYDPSHWWIVWEPLDDLPREVVPDLVAVVRELVSNVVRHAAGEQDLEVGRGQAGVGAPVHGGLGDGRGQLALAGDQPRQQVARVGGVIERVARARAPVHERHRVLHQVAPHVRRVGERLRQHVRRVGRGGARDPRSVSP